jgi:hypothetical protein
VNLFPCGTATYLQTPASPHVWGLFLRRSSGPVLRFRRRRRKGPRSSQARETCTALHSPLPRAGMFCSLSFAAMALRLVTPLACSSLIVGARSQTPCRRRCAGGSPQTAHDASPWGPNGVMFCNKPLDGFRFAIWPENIDLPASPGIFPRHESWSLLGHHPPKPV